MKISAVIESKIHELQTVVHTGDTFQTIAIPTKSSGFGSAVNGGELLMLALATCYCNDIYREAAKMKIVVAGVQVECTGEFGKEGEPGSNIVYSVKIDSPASPDEIKALINQTDAVAEIHNTLRKGVDVRLIV